MYIELKLRTSHCIKRLLVGFADYEFEIRLVRLECVKVARNWSARNDRFDTDNVRLASPRVYETGEGLGFGCISIAL